MQEEVLYYIALTKINKIGPVLAKTLISYCGSAKSVFRESRQSLEAIPGIGKVLTDEILTSGALAQAEREIEFCLRHNIDAIHYHEGRYPRRMLYFDSCPIVIYYKGHGELNHFRTVAIVGTRTPTESGKIICEKVVEGLRPYQTMVISGLAFGVDAVAHKACVQHGIPTLAVLGHGLDRIYPQSHKSLADKMQVNGGLLTEFPSGTLPDKENFPMRNRLIAALSDAVIIIESKRKGGSIITAEFANEFNKDVFAVPGRVSDEYSEGCNKLIKQNKAHLLETAEDVAYIMRWEELDKNKDIQGQLFLDLEPAESEIIDCIRQAKTITIDALTYKLKLAPSEVSSLLLGLEFKGLVRSLPGKKYILN
jgi:DNA processing protein